MWRAYRQKRIVHINVNIIIAGVISTVLASYPVYLASFIFKDKIIFVISAFIIDGVVDFALFGFLHFIVNLFSIKNGMSINVFIHDVLRIQKHRMALISVFFILAVGGHLLLINFGLGNTISYVLSYISAILITRAIHTCIGLKRGLFNDLKN